MYFADFQSIIEDELNNLTDNRFKNFYTPLGYLFFQRL